MNRSPFGTYVETSVAGETVRAFVPPDIPVESALTFEPETRACLDRALLTLGRLDGTAKALPDVELLLYTFVRKEAVLSSQIEGTQSTLDDLLQYELDGAAGVPLEDVREVSRYVMAMNHGLERMRGGFPLSNRLLREMHEVLLTEGRGGQKQPGEFRKSQNWIGGTRPGNAAFIPPPPNRLDDCLSALEKYLHVPGNPLIKAALAHLQFENIHPFLDGNGRIGRLLITLMLCHDGVLSRPLLYPSLYFKEHRPQYYEELNRVRATGDYERWIDFFAEAIGYSAQAAIEAGQRVTAVFAEDRVTLKSIPRIAGNLLLVQEALMAKPMATIAALTKATGLTTPTVTSALRELEARQIVRETTGRARDRIFVYARYMNAMRERRENGAEPGSEAV
jgi:Fic family protein